MSRTCCVCGKTHLTNGYCIDDGLSYYCSEKCLSFDFTEEEYLQAYEDDWAYWTEWEIEEDEN